MGIVQRVIRRFVANQVQLPVPIVPQSANFSCGSACLLAVLHYWKGDDIGLDHEADLWGPLAISRETGAEPEQIVGVAKDFGLHARHFVGMTQKDLRRFLADGSTVILLLQAWKERPIGWLADWDDGHYVVLVGMDGQNAYFMDPTIHTSYGWMPLADLDARWHNPDRNGVPNFGEGVVVRGVAAVTAFPGAPQRMR